MRAKYISKNKGRAEKHKKFQEKILKDKYKKYPFNNNIRVSWSS